LPGSDQIPAELIQAGEETLLKLINSIWIKEELHDQWGEEPIFTSLQKE
jgi:hypothetical protein